MCVYVEGDRKFLLVPFALSELRAAYLTHHAATPPPIATLYVHAANTEV